MSIIEEINENYMDKLPLLTKVDIREPNEIKLLGKKY